MEINQESEREIKKKMDGKNSRNRYEKKKDRDRGLEEMRANWTETKHSGYETPQADSCENIMTQNQKLEKTS